MNILSFQCEHCFTDQKANENYECCNCGKLSEFITNEDAFNTIKTDDNEQH